MSDTKHTKGNARTYKLASGEWPIRDENGGMIALVPATAYEGRDEANARHLAHCWNTNPALLEALDRVSSKLTNITGIIDDEAVALLATARA